MRGRYRGKKLRIHGGEDPLAGIASLLGRGDVTFANLETPISDDDPARITRSGKRAKYSVIFRAPTAFAGQMKRAGITVVSLANNHAEDCGKAAVADTVAAAKEAGVHTVGASHEDAFAPLIITVKGRTVIVLAYSLFRNAGEPRQNEKVPVAYINYRRARKVIAERITSLRTAHTGALILVSMHWGGEFKTGISPFQRKLGHWLIDAGANAVLGHHPHVLQPVEAYGGGLILYSMGNLVFDMIRRDGRQSAVFEMGFQWTGEKRWRANALLLHPILLQGIAAGPRPAEKTEAGFLKGLAAASARRFGTVLKPTDEGWEWRRPPPSP